MPEYPPAPKPTLYRQVSDVLQPVGLIEDTLGLISFNGDEVLADYVETINRATASIREQVQSLLTRVYDEYPTPGRKP